MSTRTILLALALCGAVLAQDDELITVVADATEQARADLSTG